MKFFIFGAKATATGLYKALSVLEPDKKIEAFLVSDTKGNVQEIFGCPVRKISDISEELSLDEKKNSAVYVAVPELIHGEIKELLSGFGFTNNVMLDSRKEADIMERYYEKEGRFKPLHSLPLKGSNPCNLTVYAASFYKDKPLNNPPIFPTYIKRLLVGSDIAKQAGVDYLGYADFYDNYGDNISLKNPNYCETTAHYWVWKNRLETDDEYVGICHYRRCFDLSKDDLFRIKENDVDVILPFPMIHYPNSGIHHSWYVEDSDWDTMLGALEKIHPNYMPYVGRTFDKAELYNYNMIIAKKNVFSDFCKWLYPVLEEIENEISIKESQRKNRYMGYLVENLLTLYFMSNFDKLKIYHTGRILYV